MAPDLIVTTNLLPTFTRHKIYYRAVLHQQINASSRAYDIKLLHEIRNMFFPPNAKYVIVFNRLKLSIRNLYT